MQPAPGFSSDQHVAGSPLPHLLHYSEANTISSPPPHTFKQFLNVSEHTTLCLAALFSFYHIGFYVEKSFSLEKTFWNDTMTYRTEYLKSRISFHSAESIVY